MDISGIEYNPGALFLNIPIYNRFDHTNISELVIKLKYEGSERALHSPDIKPHARGTLVIHMEDWNPDKEILLEFFTGEDRLVDKYAIKSKTEFQWSGGDEPGEPVQIEDDDKHLVIICEGNTRVIINRSTGLIKEIQRPSGTFLISGPVLNLRTKGNPVIYGFHKIKEYYSDWILEHFSYRADNNEVIITSNGKYAELPDIEIEMIIRSDGLLTCSYQLGKAPDEYIREVGIMFELDSDLDSLSWKRDPYWSHYPAGHLSAPEGKVSLYSGVPTAYRSAPEKKWIHDTKSFYYGGSGDEAINEELTHIARATKEHIREYNLCKNGEHVLSVLGRGDVSCRIALADNGILLFANNKMDYVDLEWGNFQKNIKLDDDYSDEIVFKIHMHSADP